MPAAQPVNEIHQPHAFDPMAYDFVGAFDSQHPGRYLRTDVEQEFEITLTNGEVWAMVGYDMLNARDRCLKAIILNSATSAFCKGSRGSQCDHCGAHIRYVVVIKHRSTGDYLAIGEQCAQNRIGSMDQATWQVKQLREAAQRVRQAERNREARLARNREWLAESPARAQVVVQLENLTEAHPNDNFYRSLSRYYQEQGMLTHSQERAVVRAAEREAARAVRLAAEALEPVVPVQAGKQTVTGEVLSLRWQESDYGSVLKMLVKSTTGFKVYGSVPQSLKQAVEWDNEKLVGKRIRFTAQLEPKANEPGFGYFKRPTQATVVTQP